MSKKNFLLELNLPGIFSVPISDKKSLQYEFLLCKIISRGVLRFKITTLTKRSLSVSSVDIFVLLLPLVRSF